MAASPFSLVDEVAAKKREADEALGSQSMDEVAFTKSKSHELHAHDAAKAAKGNRIFRAAALNKPEWVYAIGGRSCLSRAQIIIFLCPFAQRLKRDDLLRWEWFLRAAFRVESGLLDVIQEGVLHRSADRHFSSSFFDSLLIHSRRMSKIPLVTGSK